MEPGVEKDAHGHVLQKRSYGIPRVMLQAMSKARRCESQNGTSSNSSSAPESYFHMGDNQK